MPFPRLKFFLSVARSLGNDGLVPDFAEPPAESPSTIYSSLIAASLDEQSAKFPWQDWILRVRFFFSLIPALFSQRFGLVSHNSFFHDYFGNLTDFPIEICKCFAENNDSVTALDFTVSKFCFRLSFKLRIWMFNRNDRRNPFPDIITG